MRDLLTLPKIDYSDLDGFVFPSISNRLDLFKSDIIFNPWGSGKPLPYHCFVDDWRIESIWRDSYMMLNKFIHLDFPVAISPDFTVHKDYPLPLAFHQVWRSRVVARYWQDCGVFVIPALQWSRPSINAILFQGLAQCEIVAVRSPTKGFEKPWCDSAKQFLQFNSPKRVLHFGTSRGLNVWGDSGVQMNLTNK